MVSFLLLWNPADKLRSLAGLLSHLHYVTGQHSHTLWCLGDIISLHIQAKLGRGSVRVVGQPQQMWAVMLSLEREESCFALFWGLCIRDTALEDGDEPILLAQDDQHCTALTQLQSTRLTLARVYR